MERKHATPAEFAHNRSSVVGGSRDNMDRCRYSYISFLFLFLHRLQAGICESSRSLAAR